MLYPLYFELLTVLKIIAFFHCFLFYTQNFGSRCASLTAFSETDPDEKQNKKYKNQIPIYQKWDQNAPQPVQRKSETLPKKGAAKKRKFASSLPGLTCGIHVRLLQQPAVHPLPINDADSSK